MWIEGVREKDIAPVEQIVARRPPEASYVRSRPGLMITTKASPLLNELCQRYAAEFGRAPARRFFAPGRVNLVGAHLDYNGGDVLPMAVDRGVYAVASLRNDGRICLRSLDQQLQIDLPQDQVGERGRPEWGWANYPLGVWHGFAKEHGKRAGLQMVFAGDLPMASGLSSSAAIEVVTALALDALHGLRLPHLELAMLAHRAENGFVGVRCGIMDQFASALAQPGKVLWLQCSGPRWEHVPFDPRVCEVLVMDTKKPRLLAKTGFNERVAECAAAHAVLRTKVRDLPHLAMYDLADLEQARADMPPVVYLRARHVVTEMVRLRLGIQALRAGDYPELGRQLNASHASTASDYAVSCEELDAITAAARAHPAVYGARLTGAGFGGCAIALIQPGSSGVVGRAVAEPFAQRFGVSPSFDLLRIGSGPGEIR
jgi:galactokinase